MTDYMKEAKRLAQAYADAVHLGDGNDEVLAALLAHIQRGVPEGDDGKRVLREVFALCEDTEAKCSEEPGDFSRGRRFEAKGIARAIGAWYQEEFCGRTHMGEPAAAPDHFRDAAKMMAVQPSCMTCGDHGMVGGLLPNGGGYEAHSCPDCTAPAPAEPERRIGPASDADMAVYQSIADGYSTRAPAPADGRIAAAIHYPECWDTAAYPTVESALSEVYAHYRCTEHDAPAGVPMTQAATDVLAERQRQISAEGWTPEHDDDHLSGAIPMAAACYAAHAGTSLNTLEYSAAQNFIRQCWPWNQSWWKPTAPRRDLVKAAALLLAEIERLDRAATRGEVKP